MAENAMLKLPAFWPSQPARLLISNIDIDTIDDTFEVSISISTILTYKSIDRGIDDTFLVFFIDIMTSILLN